METVPLWLVIATNVVISFWVALITTMIMMRRPRRKRREPDPNSPLGLAYARINAQWEHMRKTLTEEGRS